MAQQSTPPTKAKWIASAVMGAFLILGAVGHIMTPEISSGFIPDAFSKDFVHLGAAIVEGILGIGVFIPAFRKRALMGILILMILFFPVHLIDLFRTQPIIGSTTVAAIRLAAQVLLIYLPWYARKV